MRRPPAVALMRRGAARRLKLVERFAAALFFGSRRWGDAYRRAMAL